MVTGHASGQGIGGQQLRTILGTAGIQLEQQRQQQASGLLTSAQNLENSRQNILQGLFPSLNQTQLSNLGAQGNVLNESAGMLPNAGLGGQAITNVMLARVGATNQLAQSAAAAGAQGAMAQGQIWGNAAGALGSTAARAIPSIPSNTGWNTPANDAYNPANGYNPGGGFQ
jgi:hypothetical protein